MSGEDPFLGAALAPEAVQGIQSKGVIANAKHWVDNSQETNRTTNIAVVDERTQMEIYCELSSQVLALMVCPSTVVPSNRVLAGQVLIAFAWFGCHVTSPPLAVF